MAPHTQLEPKTMSMLQMLARENGVSSEVLLATLVENEDRKRHVEIFPFEGEKRVHCHNRNCPETAKRMYERTFDEF